MGNNFLVSTNKEHRYLATFLFLTAIGFAISFPSLGQRKPADCATQHYTLGSDDPVPTAMQTLRIVSAQRSDKTPATAEVILPSKLLLYPNPAGSILRVSLPTRVQDVAQVQLFDMLGRQYPVKVQKAGGSAYRIAVSDLATGVYVLKVYQKDGTEYKQRFSKR